MTQSLSGGCQCGAVRFRTDGPLRRASVCHCRMCQKAFGAPFGAHASFAATDVTWTRGERKRFLSSRTVARAFCGDCGTTLTFEAAQGGRNVALAIAAFDDPAGLVPERQIGLESRLPWLDQLNALPPQPPEEAAAQEARYGPRVSHQHPDHDTDTWPPES